MNPVPNICIRSQHIFSQNFSLNTKFPLEFYDTELAFSNIKLVLSHAFVYNICARTELLISIKDLILIKTYFHLGNTFEEVFNKK